MMKLNLLTKFKRDYKGASLVEFALILPLLCTIALGIYETTRYVMLSAKLNEIATGLATWVGQQTSTATITDCLIGANLMGSTYNFSTTGAVVVSGLQQVGVTSAQLLVWQKSSPGGASQIHTNSVTGIVTSAPFTIALEPNLIVVEVTYNYTPMFTYFLSIFPPVQLLRVSQSVPSGAGSFFPLAAS